ncbi:murein biosynthesis integral membrane protein MurJ [Sphingomonas japonica]|uniref:Probable lipid II flippase MurJ n=1 Tax=Sphingomonas japonica TaxID=511662 RepID=A0ABX0U5M5_9SPHN|nr:murein biosynthesis integral membrane protein MurJ [Sphingomonas japonica]NIJ24686.1 putative peptidoglycan lipid II flippase [Sphingomonas japonica]
MKLVKALGSVGGLTLASRILALARDALQATYVGAGFASDAFLVAFRLPNMFRAFFAEGAFSAAFVPMFSRKVGEAGGDVSVGLRFAEAALAVLFPILVVFTAVMIAAAWPVTLALSGGFDNPTAAQFDFAVLLSRITMPYLMLMSLVALLGGILNSVERYWVNAAAPILLNVAMVTALLWFHGTPEETARVQAISVTVGGVLQLLWMIAGCRMAGISLRLRMPKIDADMRQLLRLILPAAVGAGAMQINLAVSTALAGGLLSAGSISYIYYADRLNQLPLGLIGIGLGTILLPTIARQLGGGRDAEAIETQNRGVELALLLTLPAMVAFLACAVPIVRGLFEHGAFTPADTLASAQALAVFSLGLPAYVLIKVLTPGFYAREDTRTPVRFAMISVAVNLIGNLALIPTIGHIGPPLATAVSAWVNMILLYRTLRGRGHFAGDARLKRRLPRLALAAVVMGAVLVLLTPLFDPYLRGNLVESLLPLIVLVGSGTLLYAIACFATGAFRLADLKALRRRSS